MEIRDAYDANKQLTGITYLAKDKVSKGYYELVVVIFIENSKGEFLMQKRSPKKDGKWATTGGHPKSGESSREGIITEVMEEIGIDISNLPFDLVYYDHDDKTHCDIYYLKKDIDITKCVLDEEEVSDVKWMKKEEIYDLLSRKEFKKSHAEMFENMLRSI